MKRALPLILLLLPFVIAAGEPFIVYGDWNALIVVGDDAPPAYVLLGAEIAAYLQQYADDPGIGISAVVSSVGEQEGALILIGLPENNALIRQYTGVDSGDEFDGPYLELIADIQIISGSSQEDVAEAADMFREDIRNFGNIVAVEGDDEEEEQEEDVEDEEVPVPPVPELYEEPEEFTDEILSPPETCEPLTYCKENTVKSLRSDCSEESIEYCPSGCKEGVCQRTLFEKILDWIFFWR